MMLIKKKKLKNSIYHEKYNYLQSLCFPQGNQNVKDICTDKDYGIIIKIFSELIENMTYYTVETLIFDKESVELKSKDYLYFIISVIIMIFPFLIKLILIFSKIMIEKNQKKSEIINKLISDDDSSISINNKKEHENKIIREKKVNDSFIFPKWYRILNEYFDIIKNGEELFKFSNNESNFNNFNGITYIKGILGISLILNVFGQTFFILSNLPHKTMATYQFYDTVFSLFYFIIFIGLRYAPRLIFSCIGYSLIYKFLFFIESESSFYFLKFLILHSYKYILLICISLFMRYSLYCLGIIVDGKRKPIFEVFKHNLEKSNKNYFLNLLTLMFYNLNKSGYDNGESAVRCLYLPVNEIQLYPFLYSHYDFQIKFFKGSELILNLKVFGFDEIKKGKKIYLRVFLFIFGIALISTGYKFKIRIDLIIIFFILILYLAKIISFFTYI